MNTDRRSYELRLVTLLAMLVMVGAWSWAQPRSIPSRTTIRPVADQELVAAARDPSELNRLRAWNEHNRQAFNEPAMGTIMLMTLHLRSYSSYAWPTTDLRWNLSTCLLLTVCTGLVAERLSRCRLRVSLAELLLAVTVTAVGIALAQSFWAETQLAERAVAVRVILLAGGYCVLLVVGWGAMRAATSLRQRMA